MRQAFPERGCPFGSSQLSKGGGLILRQTQTVWVRPTEEAPNMLRGPKFVSSSKLPRSHEKIRTLFVDWLILKEEAKTATHFRADDLLLKGQSDPPSSLPLPPFVCFLPLKMNHPRTKGTARELQSFFAPRLGAAFAAPRFGAGATRFGAIAGNQKGTAASSRAANGCSDR